MKIWLDLVLSRSEILDTALKIRENGGEQIQKKPGFSESDITHGDPMLAVLGR